MTMTYIHIKAETSGPEKRTPSTRRRISGLHSGNSALVTSISIAELMLHGYPLRQWPHPSVRTADMKGSLARFCLAYPGSDRASIC